MFLDTSGLLCLIHVHETQQEKAVSSYDAATTPRLTHSYVLDEFIALAQSRKLSREAALDFSEKTLQQHGECVNRGTTCLQPARQ